MSETDDTEGTERREAEALAHALERGSAREMLPEDALQTAALLRYSVDGGELPADREEALLSEVLESATRIADKKRAAAPEASGVPFVRWLFGFAGAAALAALVLLLLGRGPVEPTALPEPTAALIGAGLEHLGEGGDRAAYRALMSDYRGQVYGALSARYDGR